MTAVNEEALLETLLDLVRIYGPAKDERRVADYIASKLRESGLDVEEDDAGKCTGGSAGNLIVRLEGGLKGPGLVFVAHMDTVEPAEDVVPEVEAGIISSEGDTILGADDRAGIAVLLETIKMLVETDVPHSPLEFVFTIAEETGLVGAKNLDTSKLKSRCGFVLDSHGAPGTAAVIAPSHITFEARCKGRSAHAGIEPEKGINAVQIASKGVSEMQLGRIDEDTTANIGKIQGGKATNIVPDLAIVKGEARSFDADKLERQIEHMFACMRTAAEELGGEVEIEAVKEYETYRISDDALPVKLLKEAAKMAGLECKLESCGGGSDANVLNSSGISSVVLGLGYRDVHTCDESMDLKDLTDSARLVAVLISAAGRFGSE
ncbi:M20/M25/M40 family metallo-hydrolase [Candidatus Hydrogenedentota bacterium]